MISNRILSLFISSVLFGISALAEFKTSDPFTKEFFKDVTVENYNKIKSVDPLNVVGQLIAYRQSEGANVAAADQIIARSKFNFNDLAENPEKLDIRNSVILSTAAGSFFMQGKADLAQSYYRKLGVNSHEREWFICDTLTYSLNLGRHPEPEYKVENLYGLVGALSDQNLSDTTCTLKDSKQMSAEKILQTYKPDLYNQVVEARRLKSIGPIERSKKPESKTSVSYCTQAQIKSYLNSAKAKARELGEKQSYAFSNKNELCEFTGVISAVGTDFSLIYVASAGQGHNQQVIFNSTDECTAKIFEFQKQKPRGIIRLTAEAKAPTTLNPLPAAASPSVKAGK